MAVGEGLFQVICLARSRAAWGSDAFNEVLKAEMHDLSAHELPLQQGLSLSSFVSAEPFQVMIIHAAEESGVIRVKAGIFYSGIIAGCSCSDDPTPTDVQAEYCEVECAIDMTTGEAEIKLLA